MFPSSSILTMKIVLISCGIVSLAVAVKYTFIPLIIHFTVSDLPTVWSVILLMFKPPYLYIVLNGIIIIIAAISRFTQNQTESSYPLIPPIVELPSPVVEEVVVPTEVWDVKMPVVVNGLDVGGGEEVVEVNLPVEVVVPPSPVVVGETEVILPVKEKPLVLTASTDKKHSIFCREGRSQSTKMRVINPNRHETLDSTWKMITEGRHAPPLITNMKNSDTFENLEHSINSSARQNSLFRKSATFKDRTNFLHEPPLGNIRKEPSLGKEELNSRVEAFIKKFNEEMRLQRQESLQRYKEMVNRGAN